LLFQPQALLGVRAQLLQLGRQGGGGVGHGLGEKRK
jgi:hypothetical protein